MKNAIRFGGYALAASLLTLSMAGYAGAVAPTSAPQSVKAPSNSFLASDDYSDKDQITGKFLKDPEYARMTEDFTRNGGDDFDWGWAAPNFDIHKYKTAHLVVKDDFGVLDPDFTKYTHTLFASVAKRLGLTVVSDGAPADIELGFDIVGYDTESHYAFVTVVQPMVQLEMRIKDLKTGQDLFLARNTEHDSTPKAALTETAQDLLHMLR